MTQLQNVKNENQGIIYSLLTLGTGFADRALGVGFGLAEEVLTETRKCIGLSIDLLEAVAQSVARVARDTNGRVGDLLSDTVAQSLASGRSVVRLFQIGGDHVSALAGDVLARNGETAGRPSSPQATA